MQKMAFSETVPINVLSQIVLLEVAPYCYSYYIM